MQGHTCHRLHCHVENFVTQHGKFLPLKTVCCHTKALFWPLRQSQASKLASSGEMDFSKNVAQWLAMMHLFLPFERSNRFPRFSNPYKCFSILETLFNIDTSSQENFWQPAALTVLLHLHISLQQPTTALQSRNWCNSKCLSSAEKETCSFQGGNQILSLKAQLGD